MFSKRIVSCIRTENMVKHGLLYQTDGYVNDYREDVSSNVINEHANAAFRYFHSAIQGHINLMTENRVTKASLRLSDFFNRPGVIEDGDNMDRFSRGMTTQSQEDVDRFLTSEITDYLFRHGMPFGRDLRAIDVQRGRDHGLASYNDFRQFCGLPRAHTFQDFSDFIAADNIHKLSILYHSPDDVDLVIGGSLEAHVPKTLTGPTFLCIMTEQFYRTRVSDRYFYETGDSKIAFTPEQLKEIKKATVARLFCDNGDNIQHMQPEGFKKIRQDNPLLHCDQLPVVNLNLWKEAVPPPHVNHFSSHHTFEDIFGKKK